MNETRDRMIAYQLEARGIRDRRVIEAMGRVQRERFVPHDRRDAAYEDRALPLESGQTISQPFMVARTLELARVAPTANVLDVGTGSGYQAAILAEFAAHVVTIERIESLAESARALLTELGYADKIEVIVGDGSLGWDARAPYDAILVAAASPRVPPALASQLAIGGRLVIPVGSRAQQWLTIVERRSETELVQTEEDACVYVPLLGAAGFHE